MDHWQKQLKFNPIEPMVGSSDLALVYFVKRDLLDAKQDCLIAVRELPQVKKILQKQLANGSWPAKKGITHPAINYPLIETWKWYRHLVQQYGMTRDQAEIEKASEFIFSCQTRVGDFRGFLANQYATYYTGAILYLLILAGYGDDPRVDKCFEWLISMRQSDGGWTIPILTHHLKREEQYRLTSEYCEPIEPVRSKPLSHNWTGMILRAFSIHPAYRFSEPAQSASKLLADRFFKPDTYTSYQDAGYWLRFDYPYWWSNLLTALDAVSLINPQENKNHICSAVLWFRENQQNDGLWKTSYSNLHKESGNHKAVFEKRLWITYAICKVMKTLEKQSILL